jgi:uncharacterized protein (DUF2267 family)
MIQTSHRAAGVVRDFTGLDDLDSAMGALEVVAAGIVRRLPPAEAGDFVAQLPSELHESLLDLPAGPDKNISLETIRADLAARLDIELDAAAKLLTDVGLALRTLLSRGEVAHVLAQLPRDMQDILPDAVPHPTP